MLWLRLLLLFTLVPFIELILLLWINSKIGLLLTVGLVLGTGAIGAAVAVRQGLKILRFIQKHLAEGSIPGGVLADDLMVFLAGILLIAPGVLTDLLGFALLVPAIREKVKVRLVAWIKERTIVQFSGLRDGFRSSHETRPNDAVIDADFTRRPIDDSGREL